MKVSDSTSSPSLLSASLRAQETRKAYGQSETDQPPRAERPVSGKDASASGKELPANAAAAQSVQTTERATGLANAIAQLQQNSEKNPQASGLLRALESLTERQNTAQSVDTEA